MGFCALLSRISSISDFSHIFSDFSIRSSNRITGLFCYYYTRMQLFCFRFRFLEIYLYFFDCALYFIFLDSILVSSHRLNTGEMCNSTLELIEFDIFLNRKISLYKLVLENKEKFLLRIKNNRGFQQC